MKRTRAQGNSREVSGQSAGRLASNSRVRPAVPLTAVGSLGPTKGPTPVAVSISAGGPRVGLPALDARHEPAASGQTRRPLDGAAGERQGRPLWNPRRQAG